MAYLRHPQAQAQLVLFSRGSPGPLSHHLEPLPGEPESALSLAGGAVELQV